MVFLQDWIVNPMLNLLKRTMTYSGFDDCNENYLSLIFLKINDFVHRFILDNKSVDFTILVVSFTILYC
jgi:hypothetical protein